MANKEYDWGSLFNPNKEQAIPVPTVPKFDGDWGSLVTNVPDTPIVPPVQPDKPNEQRQGWSSFEPWTGFVEGVKGIGHSVEKSMSVPTDVSQDVSSRLGFAQPPVEGWNPEDYPEEIRGKVEDINKIQDLTRLIGSMQSPSRVFLGLMKFAGYLEPDMEYARRLQDKKDVVQIAEQTIAVAPQMAINMFAGLAGGLPGVMLATGTQIFGGSYERHSEKHKPLEAAGLAMIDTIPQAAIESMSTIFMLGGGKAFSFLTKPKVLNKLAKTLNGKTTKWLKKATDTVIGRISGGMVMEGGEEYAQSITEMLADYLSLRMQGKKPTGADMGRMFDQKHKDGKRGAIIGFLWGGMGGAAGIGLEKMMTPLKDANPEVDPKNTPDKVSTKLDARAMLEKASERAMQEAEAEAEATQIAGDLLIAEEEQAMQVPDPLAAESALTMGGVPTLPEAGQTTVSDQVAADVVDTLFDTGVQEDLKESELDDVDDAPSYRQRVESGELTPDQARMMHEEEFLADPSKRPAWAPTFEHITEPKTDSDYMRNQTLKNEAAKAHQADMGKDVKLMAESVGKYVEFLNKESKAKEGLSHAEVFGDDYIRQVEDKELSTMQKLWKNVAKSFYGRDVFFIDYNNKVKNSKHPYEKKNLDLLMKKRGARMAGSGAIVVVKGEDLKNTGTIFHELTHDMNLTSPELWTKLSDFLTKNASAVSVKEEVEQLQKNYTGTKDELADELGAGFVGDILMKEEAQLSLLNKLRKQDPTTYQKLLTFIKDALEQLKIFLGLQSQKEARLLVKDVDSAIDFVTSLLTEFSTVSKTSMVGKTREQLQAKPESELVQQQIEDSAKKEVKWFSAMNKYLESALPGKGGAKQYVQLIHRWKEKGEFKSEELEWAQLEEWLNDPDTLKVLNASDEWNSLNKHLQGAIDNQNNEAEQKTRTRMAKLGEPEPAKVFTKKQIMEYLKENEVTIEEVHKVEKPGQPDFDLPQAMEDRQRLMQKIHHALPEDILIERTNNIITHFTIVSTDEAVNIDNMATEVLEKMGASPIHAENILSDMQSLQALDQKITNAQETQDPALSVIMWEERLKGMQDTLRIDHNAHIVSFEGKVIHIRSFETGEDIEFGKNDVEKNLLNSMQDAITKIKELKELDPFVPAQYGPASTPALNIGGGENYMELLLTLPKVKPEFFHGHWKDVPNVVAMVRFDFRVVDGKKVLLIQELQSDWHQQGSKRGYYTKDAKKIIELPEGSSVRMLKDSGRWMVTLPDGLQMTAATRDEVIQAGLNRINAGFGLAPKQGVPDAPYKKSWSDLAMKRMVKMAAELGQDYLAWVPAEVIQERYSLVKRGHE